MIESISAAAPGTAASGNGLGALDSEAFLKLLVAQLRYQNPLEPTDASAMMQQTAAFSQVETLQAISASQQTALGMSEALMASGLIGKTVTAVRPDDTVIQGTATGVRFTSAGPVLEVGGEEVVLAAITQIASAPADAASSVPDGSDASPDSTTSGPDTAEARVIGVAGLPATSAPLTASTSTA